MHRVLVSFLCSAALAISGGCASWLPSYKIPVQQGNYIDPSLTTQLRPGMTKEQVQSLLGTPLLTDPFHPNRWDYIYTFGKGTRIREERGVTLYFEGDTLSRIESLGATSP